MDRHAKTVTRIVQQRATELRELLGMRFDQPQAERFRLLLLAVLRDEGATNAGLARRIRQSEPTAKRMVASAITAGLLQSTGSGKRRKMRITDRLWALDHTPSEAPNTAGPETFFSGQGFHSHTDGLGPQVDPVEPDHPDPVRRTTLLTADPGLGFIEELVSDETGCLSRDDGGDQAEGTQRARTHHSPPPQPSPSQPPQDRGPQATDSAVTTSAPAGDSQQKEAKWAAKTACSAQPVAPRGEGPQASSPVERWRGLTCYDLAPDLGLTRSKNSDRWLPCPGCGATTSSRANYEHRGALRFYRGGRRWKCYRPDCPTGGAKGPGGDAVDLVAWCLTHRPFNGNPDAGAVLRWLEARHGAAA